MAASGSDSVVLPDEASFADAERAAERDFASTYDGAREQQVGDVRAGDEENYRRDTAGPDDEFRLRAGKWTARRLYRSSDCAKLRDRRRRPVRGGSLGEPASLIRGREIGFGGSAADARACRLTIIPSQWKP